MSFTCAEHFDKAESFAAVYRDAVEIIIVQAVKGRVSSNTAEEERVRRTAHLDR